MLQKIGLVSSLAAACAALFLMSFAEANSLKEGIHDYGSTPQLWRKKLVDLNKGGEITFRIVQIGDSHTAGAFFTDELRERLQKRWGNGGIGWVFPQQIKGQRTTMVRYQGGWKVFTARKDHADFPLGGVLARSLPNQSLTLIPNIPVFGEQQLTFAMRPVSASTGLGKLTVRSADGKTVPAYGLHGNVWQYFNVSAVLPVQFQAPLNEVWEIGAINIENGRKGVVVSGLGINGAQLTQWSNWRTDWHHDLAETRADLVILAYGTNEAFNARLNVTATEQHWHDTVRRIRETLPDAAVLIVGAPESLTGKQGICGVRPERLDEVQKMQQRVAETEGILYWSWQTAMGGECSMNGWVKQNLAARDGVHFSATGYRRTADVLATDLLDFVKKIERDEGTQMSSAKD